MDELLEINGEASAVLEQGVAMVMAYAPRVVLAIITLLIGLWLIRRLVNALDHRLGATDPTLNSFLRGLVSVVLKVLLLVSVASMVGIATTSFVAVIGAAGLAIGLALQGSLANFAGGVLILIFKPFKVGDAIEAQGFVGTVIEIQILHTILNTFDNRRVVIPNGNLSNSSLINMSVNTTRRADMSFAISYSDNIDKAKEICQRLVEADPRVLKDPAPMVVVGSLGDNSVNLTVRCWTNAGDLWPFQWGMLERVKKAFDAEGITIPLPQRDVHLHKVD